MGLICAPEPIRRLPASFGNFDSTSHWTAKGSVHCGNKRTQCPISSASVWPTEYPTLLQEMCSVLQRWSKGLGSCH